MCNAYCFYCIAVIVILFTDRSFIHLSFSPEVRAEL